MRNWMAPASLLLAAGLATAAGAQSMGEAAAKERERREKLRQGKPAPKVITEDDLRGAGRPRGTYSNPAATEAPAPDPGASPSPGAPAPGAAAGPKEKTDDEVRAERQAAWRERMKRAQEDVASLTQRVDQLQLQANNAAVSAYSTGRANLLSELESSKTLLAAARQTLTNLEEEGRRSSFTL